MTLQAIETVSAVVAAFLAIFLLFTVIAIIGGLVVTVSCRPLVAGAAELGRFGVLEVTQVFGHGVDE